MAEDLRHKVPHASGDDAPEDLLTTVRQNDIHIYDLVLAQASQAPFSEAIATTQESLTYQEMIRRARIMHKILKDADLHPGDRVMLLSDKNPGAICSCLAILKLKAICVIVNPVFPEERLSYIVSHVHCKAIVTDALFEEKAARLKLSTISIPSSWSMSSIPDDETKLSTSDYSAQNGAVVTFTSGSTGKPKAVLYSHAAMSNMAVALGRDFGYGAHTRGYQFAAFGWVIALQDIFITLVNGGTICLPTTYQIENELVQTMQRLRSNHLNITSSLVSTLDDDDLKAIRTLIFVGEAANPETVVRLDKNGRNVIVNYGCSEANTILGTNVLIRGRDLFFIGSNSTNTPWLVDPDDHNVLLDTPGAIGELISESSTAPTGLLTDDGVGGECFISPPTWRKSHPASEWHQTTFVKTGDLFQFTENGHWKCIGRKDFQIKIRGQRLDPYEVEYYVRRHVQGVSELACVKGQFKDSSKDLLVVFVCFDEQTAQGLQENWTLGLDHILLQNLPSFMLPAGFIVASKLPRTATGKEDRRTIVR
jgi:acyl-coenzyme A synthetase/AMP-(fatty) acid ligase